MASGDSADEGPDRGVVEPSDEAHEDSVEHGHDHTQQTHRNTTGVGTFGRRRLLQTLGVASAGGFAGCATIERFLPGGDEPSEYGFGGTTTATTATTATTPTTATDSSTATTASSTQSSTDTSTATTVTSGTTPEGEYGLQGYGQYGYGGTR